MQQQFAMAPILVQIFFFFFKKILFIATLDALLTAGADINSCAKNGISPIAIAVFAHLAGLIQYLISKGAQVKKSKSKEVKQSGFGKEEEEEGRKIRENSGDEDISLLHCAIYSYENGKNKFSF